MPALTIELATTSKEVLDRFSNRQDLTVATNRNFTGESILILTAVLPVATVLIKEVAKIVHEREATIRAQKLKIGKGTISFEGFSQEAIANIVSKLSEMSDGEEADD